MPRSSDSPVRPWAAALGAFSLALLSACGVAGASEKTFAVPEPVVDMAKPAAATPQTAVFAGGCFWGVDAVFKHVKGVSSVTSGYAGGPAKMADYHSVSTGSTGHAESVKVVYDPTQVSYGQLLKVFMSVAHDPTQLNRQGPDSGTQYRSAIFTDGPEQMKVAKAYIAQLDAAKVYPGPVVTQLAPLDAFYDAEGYHQDYLARNPTQMYIVINDMPKIDALKTQWPALYTEPAKAVAKKG
ncbi:MAG: Peptide methionine sulfoxide reductase MsrA [Rhizobacter sp.]|nr:Peptide methionine sulfoxide reductase MsrA [Rhizobacter sp.]